MSGLGPTVAVLEGLRRSGRGYRASFRHRLQQWRVAPKWVVAALALTVGPKSIALLSAAAAGHTATGERMELSAVPISLIFGIIVVWIEEPLWRGVALDGFSSPARASLVIGVAWSIWHMPLFAVAGTFQHGLGLGTVDFWVFSAGVLGLCVMLTWLVVRAGGSILLAMFAHLFINITGGALPDDTTIGAIEMCIVLAVAAGLWWRLRQTQGSAYASNGAN